MLQIITDSTADLSAELCRESGIVVLPLTVRFGEESFLDGVDISNAEFYARLEAAEELPTTTQINPYSFEQAFRRELERADELVYIGISGRLSGTLQSARIARDNIGTDRIHIVDSERVTAALGLLVRIACRLRDQGMEAAELAAEISRLAPRCRIWASVSTLKYLKMSGRISSAGAALGGALGICPQITMEDGVFIQSGLAKGKKAAIRQLLQQTLDKPPDFSYPLIFGSSQNVPDMEKLLEVCRENFDFELDSTVELGSVVGTHGGPGAFGLTYIEK